MHNYPINIEYQNLLEVSFLYFIKEVFMMLIVTLTTIYSILNEH